MKEIIKLNKRCKHFLGTLPVDSARCFLDRDLSIYIHHGCAAEGIGIIAHNYAAMQSITDTYIERLAWQEASAAAINRYIDAHKVVGDMEVAKCLRWWRRQLFFCVDML